MKYALSRRPRNNGFPTLFDDFITRSLFEGRDHNFADRADMPQVNIKENEKAFELELLVPGRVKTDFQIELKDNILTVASEARPKVEEGVEYTHQEFAFKSFTRTFTLPEDMIDREKIRASYEAGVLKLNLPKKPEEMKKEVTRNIKIS